MKLAQCSTKVAGMLDGKVVGTHDSMIGSGVAISSIAQTGVETCWVTGIKTYDDGMLIDDGRKVGHDGVGLYGKYWVW